jgi:enoyl-CoA hydratase/carnithine racemase
MSEVTVTVHERIQVIRFMRPEKRNALTADMYAAISRALREGDASPEIAAHVFLGSGGVFTAGNDIADFLARAKGGTALGGPVLEFISLLPRVAKPMLAGVDGLAVGVGTTMLFHCDLVFASPAARLSTPFLDLGLVPEAGSSLLAPRLMGAQRAFELLVLGEPFPAERAREAGLVNAIVPAGDLEARVLAAASRLASKPPAALAASRRLLRGDGEAIAERIVEEARIFGERLKSPEAREAFSAFLEKRPPDFAKAGRSS